MKILVSWSGGKDSQACMIWAVKQFGAKNITAVFCNTGWEHPLTYIHVESVCKDLGVELIQLQSKKYKDFVDLVKKKKRFPSTKARFCTEELKSKPFIDYILSLQESIYVIQGIRAAESASRAKMQAQCRLFKYYLQPYKIDKKGKPKFHTYRAKEVKEFVKQYADEINRPFFDKSSQYVIEYIVENGQNPNPLYSMGAKRVGCWPCIMCTLAEIKNIERLTPEKLEELEELENTTFFAPSKIPERYHTKFKKDSKGVLKSSARMKDVRVYVNDKNATLEIFEENTSCMSYYGTCE